MGTMCVLYMLYLTWKQAPWTNWTCGHSCPQRYVGQQDGGLPNFNSCLKVATAHQKMFPFLP